MHILADTSFMRLCHYSSILIFTCLTCFGFNSLPASTATPNLAPNILELAQASSTNALAQAILGPGSGGKDVEALQTQLQKLGFYDGIIDGQYGISTRNAVSKFQQAKGLIADGIVGKTTWDSLQASVSQKPPNPPVTSGC
jgi:peptidoglycan hydrolase-like protein with peptidoglycan-binding domain